MCESDALLHFLYLVQATTSSEEVEVKISPCTPSLRVGRHLAFKQHPRSAAKVKMKSFDEGKRASES